MTKKKSWTEEQLRKAAGESTSVRQVIKALGLIEAGGNYAQIKKFLKIYKVDTSHFRGIGWNKGMRGIGVFRTTLQELLTRNNYYQSYKLKRRLFAAGLKKPFCEMCGWAKKSNDGRVPLELDHINGDRYDNRLDNLQILCPNCHSLQPTHRGRNKKTGLAKNL
ncbi:MAG: HNH endonuclease signature motif containing protein [Patescibacteria group bacterium]